jgi:hypothetical protein
METKTDKESAQRNTAHTVQRYLRGVAAVDQVTQQLQDQAHALPQPLQLHL